MGTKTQLQIPRLEEALQSKMKEQRRGALFELAKIDHPQAVQLIILSLEDSSPDVFRMAEEILIRMAPRGEDELMAALGHGSRTLRNYCAGILRDRGNKLGVLIFNALEKKQGALEELLSTKNPRMLLSLTAALENSESRVRHSAAEALGKTGGPEIVLPLIKAISDENGWVLQTASDGLVANGEISVAPLLEALENSKPQLQRIIMEILGKIGMDSYLDKLISFLESPHNEVREAAAEAIGNYKNPAAASKLASILEDSVPEVRRAAVSSLGRIGDPLYAASILPRIEDNDWTVRRAAAAALGKMGDSCALTALTKAMEDSDWQVRQAAAESMGKFEEGRNAEQMAGAAVDEVWFVRLAAARSLGAEGNYSALGILHDLTYDKNWNVKEAAVISLGIIGDPRAAASLREAIFDRNETVRRAAAEAMGKIGDPGSVEPLMQALKDESDQVRIAAISSLGELGDDRAGPSILPLLKDESPKVQLNAVITLGILKFEPGIHRLSDMLDSEREIRWEIVEALGRIGDTSALDPLVKLMREEKLSPKLYSLIEETALGILKANEPSPEMEGKNICHRCFTRFTRHTVNLPNRGGLSYMGCRSCKGSHGLENPGTITAVLDTGMSGDYATRGDDMEVNWLSLTRPFDFKRVHIKQADDFDVERFVMILRNSADDQAVIPLKDIPVQVDPGLSLSKNKINLLKMTFKRVEVK